MSHLDLNTLPPDLQAALNKKETDGERWVRLGKDLAVFCFALTVLLVAFLWAGWIMVDSSASADKKHIAQTIIIAIVSGLLGYLVKK